MRRKTYDRLVQWKEEGNGKTALLIGGARRVGKSCIVEEFGKNGYDSYVLINFSNSMSRIESDLPADWQSYVDKAQRLGLHL